MSGTDLFFLGNIVQVTSTENSGRTFAASFPEAARIQPLPDRGPQARQPGTGEQAKILHRDVDAREVCIQLSDGAIAWVHESQIQFVSGYVPPGLKPPSAEEAALQDGFYWTVPIDNQADEKPQVRQWDSSARCWWSAGSDIDGEFEQFVTIGGLLECPK